MRVPEFTAEASLYRTNENYQLDASSGAAKQGVIPQQDLLSPSPVPSLFHWRCSQCMPYGWQFCCPPPGFGLRCFVRRCLPPL
jgi:predicted metal-binding protein